LKERLQEKGYLEDEGEGVVMESETG
jgi:hypothetical protein